MKYRILNRALSNFTIEQHMARVELSEAIAHQWLDSGIRYAVVNGLERYPREMGRDIDIVMAKSDCATAIKDAISVSYRLGWKDFLVRNNAYGLYQVTFVGDNISMQFDLTYSDINWLMGFVNQISIDKTLDDYQMKGPFKVSMSGTDLKAIRCLYYSHQNKFVERLPFWIELLQSQRAEAYKSLFGEKIFRGFRRAVFTGLPALQEWQKSFRVKLLTQHLIKHPISSLINVLTNIKRRVCLYIKNAPPVIAIVGPDGVGKSTNIRIASEWLGRYTLDVGVKHWRPGLLPSLAMLAGKENPQTNTAVAPRREKGNFNTIRLLYYWLDFFLGHWLRDHYPPITEFHLILYDRCALDMSVDPLRYGLSSNKGTMLLYRLIPKPDITIMLYDKVDRIYERKNELSKDEIARQIEAWKLHYKEGRIDTILHVSGSEEEMGKKLGQVILDFLAQYYSLKKCGLT